MINSEQKQNIIQFDLSLKNYPSFRNLNVVTFDYEIQQYLSEVTFSERKVTPYDLNSVFELKNN